MKTRSASSRPAVFNVIGWVFGVTFLVIGILNVVLIHPVPGAFYLLLSCLYLPPADTLLSRSFGFSAPLRVKVIVGLVVLWGTLAMSELAERVL